jgi:hypothetical protein
MAVMRGVRHRCIIHYYSHRESARVKLQQGYRYTARHLEAEQRDEVSSPS